MRIVNCNNSDPSDIDDQPLNYDKEICQRHTLVFGPETQRNISQLTIGIGSVGGLGMILVEQLMRLFPARLILIDFDKVEKSNLNRLPGATILDAKLGTPKTFLAARHIWTFNPNQQVTIVEGDFLKKENQSQFRECDVLFSCFDRVGPRLAANQLCQAHGILLLDLGTGAIVKDGQLTDAGGQVIRITPGSGFCLTCAEFYDKHQASQDFMSMDELSRQQALGYVRGANVTAPQVYALNSMVASWAVWAFMRTVAGEDLQFDGIAIDALNWTSSPWIEERKSVSYCPTCGINGLAFKGDDAELLVRIDNEKSSVPPAILATTKTSTVVDCEVPDSATQVAQTVIAPDLPAEEGPTQHTSPDEAQSDSKGQ